MPDSVTVTSPANIAFIKYWGRRDHQLFLPANNSISMTLSQCLTTTTAEYANKDQIEVTFLNSDPIILTPDTRKQKAMYDQITRLKSLAGITEGIKITSSNSFPADAGIASSSSALSALTAAVLLLTGQRDKFDDRIELSRQIRLCGSGSAVRSAFGGFVEFLSGADHATSHAVQIAPETHWDLVDIVVIVDTHKKKVSSSLGHELANSSPYFPTRLQELPSRIPAARQAILDKDLDILGPLIEADCLSMFAIMMTSAPPAFYWQPGSIEVLQAVLRWREAGLPVYFTFDAGPNPHLICEAHLAPEVHRLLKPLSSVQWTLVNHPCPGVILNSPDSHPITNE